MASQNYNFDPEKCQTFTLSWIWWKLRQQPGPIIRRKFSQWHAHLSTSFFSTEKTMSSTLTNIWHQNITTLYTHIGIALHFKIWHFQSQNLSISSQKQVGFKPEMFWLEFASALHLSCHERQGTWGYLRDILGQGWPGLKLKHLWLEIVNTNSITHRQNEFQNEYGIKEHYFKYYQRSSISWK